MKNTALSLPRFYLFRFSDPTVTISLLLAAMAAIAAAGIIGAIAAKRFDGNKKQTALCFMAITAALAALLCCFFGSAAAVVKGILFSLILLSSSYTDLKTRECADHIHLLIATAAFIGTDVTAFPKMLLSAIIVTALVLLAIAVTKGKLGGADVKLSSACAFLLGIHRALAGLAGGLLLAALTETLLKKKKQEGFPLIPYLAAGFMAAYFI